MLRIPLSPAPDSAALQAALDGAPPGQPVMLLLLPGRHVSGGLRLRSDVTLHLEAGAELAFVPDYDAYADHPVSVMAEGSDRAMIVAEGAARLALTGAGRITCGGLAGFSHPATDGMGTRVPVALRPRVLVFEDCTDVTLTGLTIEDSPMWTLHFVGCQGLRLRDLTIRNALDLPNTDGIVLDGCADVAVTGCDIATADDGVVLKTSARLSGGSVPVCRAIRVAECRVTSRSCALKLGTESHADFEDITFERCTVTASNRGLGLFSRDGGAMRRVRFRDITLDCVETPDGFWGSGEAITLTVLDRRAGQPAGAIRDVRFDRIDGRMEGAVLLWSERPGGIDDVVLDDVTLEQRQGALGTGQSYDLRPTPADLEPSPDAAGRVNAWRLGPDGKVIGLAPYPGGLPGLYAHHVRGLVAGVRFARPDPLPKGWQARAIVTDG